MLDVEKLQFEKLDQEGLTTLVDWARQEGWNPGPHDAEVFWQADPDGYFGFFDEKELVAGGAIVSYGGAFGFMGLFIVKPQYRAHGIGRKLWYLRRDALLNRLNEGASIGMDGVVDMQPFYRKGGFEIAFKDERFEKQGVTLAVSPHISPIKMEDLADVLAYDQQCFGVPRSQFIKPWLIIPGNHTFKFTQGDTLKGFAVLRKATTGYKIGPLFAENEAVAEELYKACLNAAAGEMVYLDIPMVNPAAVNLVRKYDGKYVFECARMYYGQPPDVHINKVFGITTFELG